MDRSHFDALARLVSRTTSRRGALAALVSASIFGHQADPLLAKRKRKGSAHAKVKANAKANARINARTQAAACYAGTRCTPGKGRNASGCDFANSTVFFVNKDARGANVSNSNFTEADLRGADFRGANLSGACFVGADLRGARLGASVNLGGAIFCDTTMPDGSVDDSGCGQGTSCCPTCRPATCQSLGVQCGSWPDGCGGALQCGRCPLGATPACAEDGTCARCDAVCECGACVTFADGDTLCDAGEFGECGDPCESNADCTNPNLPACVVSITEPVTNETTTIASLCGPPVTVGACAALAPC
jgi:hypothetical protein